VRPLTKEEKERKETSCIDIVNSTTISLSPPKGSINFRINGETQTQFHFSHILGPECSQEETFLKTMLPLTQSFIQGGNALAFAYGITNAGKTFTVTGTKDQPGLVPRLLEVLFNSIKCHEQVS
jgi:kinesin family protein 20